MELVYALGTALPSRTRRIQQNARDASHRERSAGDRLLFPSSQSRLAARSRIGRDFRDASQCACGFLDVRRLSPHGVRATQSSAVSVIGLIRISQVTGCPHRHRTNLRRLAQGHCFLADAPGVLRCVHGVVGGREPVPPWLCRLRIDGDAQTRPPSSRCLRPGTAREARVSSGGPIGARSRRPFTRLAATNQAFFIGTDSAIRCSLGRPSI